jgi:predicted transcriptional regulator
MGTPWFKFYPTDWKSDDALKLCSASSRGVWIEMLCICHNATPYGHFVLDGQPVTDTQLSVLTGIPVDQIAQALGELASRGIFSRTSKGVIYSRKLVRDEKKSKEGAKHVKKRYQQDNEIKEKNPLPSRSPTSTPSPQIPDPRTQKDKKPSSGTSSPRGEGSFSKGLTVDQVQDALRPEDWYELLVIAPGWDRNELIRKYVAWVTERPKSLRAAFMGWVKKFTKGKPPS